MNFRLTRWKAIISIIVIVLGYIFMAITSSHDVCKLGCVQGFSYSDCPKPLPLFQEYGCCSCPTILPFQEMTTLILILLIPGILIYIIWSIFEKKKIEVKRRK